MMKEKSAIISATNSASSSYFSEHLHFLGPLALSVTFAVSYSWHGGPLPHVILLAFVVSNLKGKEKGWDKGGFADATLYVILITEIPCIYTTLSLSRLVSLHMS